MVHVLTSQSNAFPSTSATWIPLKSSDALMDLARQVKVTVPSCSKAAQFKVLRTDVPMVCVQKTKLLAYKRMAVLRHPLNAATRLEFALLMQIIATHHSNYWHKDFRCLSEMKISARTRAKYSVSVVMASFIAQIQLATAIWVETIAQLTSLSYVMEHASNTRVTVQLSLTHKQIQGKKQNWDARLRPHIDVRCSTIQIARLYPTLRMNHSLTRLVQPRLTTSTLSKMVTSFRTLASTQWLRSPVEMALVLQKLQRAELVVTSAWSKNNVLPRRLIVISLPQQKHRLFQLKCCKFAQVELLTDAFVMECASKVQSFAIYLNGQNLMPKSTTWPTLAL